MQLQLWGEDGPEEVEVDMVYAITLEQYLEEMSDGGEAHRARVEAYLSGSQGVDLPEGYPFAISQGRRVIRVRPR